MAEGRSMQAGEKYFLTQFGRDLRHFCIVFSDDFHRNYHFNECVNMAVKYLQVETAIFRRQHPRGIKEQDMKHLRSSDPVRKEISLRKNLDRARRLRTRAELQIQSFQLSMETGIMCKATLERLLSYGIRAENVKALQLSPLFFVAWADGELDRNEHDTIMDHVKSWGINPSDPSYYFISYWLEVPPSPEYFEAWRLYIGGKFQQADDASFLQLKDDTLRQVKMVAEASGGFWGFGESISAFERKEIQKFEEIFAA